MKKFFALLALVLGVVSCQTEPEGFDVNVGGEQEVMLNVSLPEATRATSAEGFDLNNLGDYSIRYILEIAYNGHVLRDVQVSESKTVTFPVRLAPGRNYQFTVWADLVKEGQNDLYYKVLEGAQDDVSALANIELKNWTPNVEARDAWTDTKSFRFGEDDLEMTLTRPFAKVRVVATDIAEIRKFGIVPTNAVVEYFETEMYTKFDAVAGAAKGETTSKTLEFAYADVDTYADVTGQFTVFADYVLVPADGNVQFTLSVYDNTKGNDALIKTNNFNTTIPVAKNKVTSIVGNVLTDGDNITVKVEDAFENGSAWNPSTDDYDVELWDGVTIEEPAYDETTKTYTIKNGNHLAWVAAAVNGTLPAETRATIEPKSFKGETIKLAKDINLNFENWTPIGIPTGYNNLFNGTFDGDGHKVANLRVDNNKGAGLFGATTGATIKNVVIDNVRLNTNHYAGAVVAWAESGAVAVKLENCVVKNAEVTVKAELVDGEWDNGDKGAALIGFAHAVNIADCKVENVKVTAYRDFAGLVGYADKTSIANCETANVELEQDLTHNYKDETPDTYGEVIGRNGGGNKIDGEDFVATATQLQAAVDAATGETTLCLGNDIVGDVTVVQKPGVKITINGRGFKYNGSIKVHSNSNYYADAALTIKKVNFETATASTNVIEALENGSQRYSNNITVEDCTFTATDAAINTSVAVQVKATRGVTVKNCTANNMHSLIQAQSCDTGDVKVIDCTVNGKNGVAFKQVKSATVEGTTITALEYGIRFDGNIDNYGIVVKNNNVTAAQPFIVRKMTGKNNTITLEGTNTLTTEAEYQIVVTNGSDDEEYVKPTGTYTLTGADAYTVFPAPFPVASWDEFTAALAAGETDIKLTEDITYNKSYDLKKNVTLDLNGKSLEISDPALMLNIFSTATIKNGTIKGKVYARTSSNITFDGVTFGGSINGDGSIEASLQVQGACNVYAKNCSFNATNSNSTKSRPLSIQSTSSGTYKFEGCSFKSNTNQNQVYVNPLSSTAKLDFTNCNFNNKIPNIMFAATCPLTNLTMSGTTKLSSVTLEINRAKDAVTAEDLAYLRTMIANNSFSSVRVFYASGSEYIR